ncbi:MAG: hypothetical protein AAF632_05470 [Bacteroidota bacterium]
MSLCQVSVRKKKAEGARKSLNGSYTPSGLFALKQAYDGYQFYQQQIKACDQPLQQVMERLNDFH